MKTKKARVAFLKQFLPPGSYMAEVGVFGGEHAEALLLEIPDLRMALVDLWDKAALSDRYKESEPNHQDLDFKQAQDSCHARILPFVPKVHMYKGASAEIAKQFPDKTFDLVYIDADHTYEGVTSDINAWACKVKSGGYIGGHDYFGPWEVKRAVTEFVLKRGLRVITSDEVVACWLVKMP